MVERHKLGQTESPYFTKTGGSSPRKIENAANSPYFFRSPASVHGSYEALGPIFTTWASSDWADMVKCCVFSNLPRTSSARKRLVCGQCQKFVSEAMAHFRGCPLMTPHPLEVDIGDSLNGTLDTRSCLEILGPHLEQQVRHLCRNQCYLRAYGPCRDWWTLRQSLLEQTDRPINRLLQCWTCKLDLPLRSVASNTPDDTSGSDVGHNRPVKRPRGSESVPQIEVKEVNVSGLGSMTDGNKNIFHPKTVFINRQTGKRYLSATQVIRSLWLRDDRATPISYVQQTAQCQTKEAGETSSYCGDVQRPCRPQTTMSSQKSDVVEMDTSKRFLASPLGLLEELFGDDPWRLLLSTILLNRTRRNQVDGVLSQLLDRWPTPHALIEMARGQEKDADDMMLDELINLIAPLGIKNRRARGIIRFCHEYVDLVTRKQKQESSHSGNHGQNGPTAIGKARTAILAENSCHHVEFLFTRQEILNLYHCGSYCADAYQIFVQREWENLHPTDHALRAYVEWKQSQATSSSIETT